MKRTFTKYPSNYVRASFFMNDEVPLARDGEWTMYSPTTFDACAKLSEGSSWATGIDERYFNQYVNKGPLYIFVNESTGEKFQSHPATGSWFYDENDVKLGKQALGEFLDEHPKFIKNEFRDLLMEYGRNGFKW